MSRSPVLREVTLRATPGAGVLAAFIILFLAIGGSVVATAARTSEVPPSSWSSSS